MHKFLSDKSKTYTSVYIIVPFIAILVFNSILIYSIQGTLNGNEIKSIIGLTFVLYPFALIGNLVPSIDNVFKGVKLIPKNKNIFHESYLVLPITLLLLLIAPNNIALVISLAISVGFASHFIFAHPLRDVITSISTIGLIGFTYTVARTVPIVLT